jgi:hypothetical protein
LAETFADPVAAFIEADAQGETGAIFADIRATLGVGVVNLVWRHLATMPGALQWVWAALKPLYLGPALTAANGVRRGIVMPAIMPFSDDTLAAAGLDSEARAAISNVLDSYHHTNALALVVFSAFLSSVEGKGNASPRSATVSDAAVALSPPPVALPRLTPICEMAPPIARTVVVAGNLVSRDDG